MAAPHFSSLFARTFPSLVRPATPVPVTHPSLVAFNTSLAGELGVDVPWGQSEDGLQVWAGNQVVAGSSPVAQGYSGHQFGSFVPLLGDGRAVLLGEVSTRGGEPVDVALKGSGRTAFSRAGDGRSALGPVLREYLVSEAMHALGVRTTRSLAAVTTGETVWRHQEKPGGVLTRVAASHLRVGTVQLAAITQDPELVRELATYALERHFAGRVEGEPPGLTLVREVAQAQAELIASWEAVGFIHGVMNTDNMTLSGETIDYGPCAFLEVYSPDAVFSSIDAQGRYRFGRQAAVAEWNLARLAEAVLPSLAGEKDAAVEQLTAAVRGFWDTYDAAWARRYRAKLGLLGEHPEDARLARGLLALAHQAGADYTLLWRTLASALRGWGEGDAVPASVTELLGEGAAEWWPRYVARVAQNPPEVGAAAAHTASPLSGPQDSRYAPAAARMDAVNPLYIPRNHLVEEALEAAEQGTIEPWHELLDVVRAPHSERPSRERYAAPAPAGFMDSYQTFCGT